MPRGRRPRLHSSSALLDPAFVELDEVHDADDLLHAVGAAHVGQRFLQELAAGGRHALLHIVAVPFGRADIGREQGQQLRVDFRVGGRRKHDLLHRRRVDAEMQAEKAVHAALVVLGVARRQFAVLLGVFSLREEPRQVQQTRRPMRQIGRRQAGQDFAG
jgi:hypothetical protein